MKKLFIYIPLLMLMISCEDDIAVIGDKMNRKDQMIGIWQLEKIEQVDLKAQSNGYPTFASIKDLTNIFPDNPYTDFSISFNADGTFTSEAGSSYMDMISSGNWSFDNDDMPSTILLNNQSENQTIIIGSLANLIYDKVEFKVEKIDSVTKKSKVLYTYYLNKK